MPTLCFIWKEPSLTQVVGASSSLIKRKVVVVAFQSQHSTKPVVLFNMETPFSLSLQTSTPQMGQWLKLTSSVASYRKD
ncbi:hypothetical protein AAG906_025325 [Vitis piasezkii]